MYVRRICHHCDKPNRVEEDIVTFECTHCGRMSHVDTTPETESDAVTLADMHVARREMQRKIMEAISEFEELTSVYVSSVSLTHVQQIASRPRTASVDAEVML